MSSATPIVCDLLAINTVELEDHRQKEAAALVPVNEIREVNNEYKIRLRAEPN